MSRFAIIKRKRIPRGPERLRDRRWRRVQTGNFTAESAEDAEKTQSGTGGNEAEDVRSSKPEVRMIGKPFQPKPQE